MIAIPRALARRYRAILRRSLMDRASRGSWPIIRCRAGPDGLFLECQQGDLALRYHAAGEQPADVLAFRASLLGELEGRDDSLVQLEVLEPGQGIARWTDGGVPRAMEFEAVSPGDFAEMPLLPEPMASMPDDLLSALAEAVRSTGEPGRYGLARVQFRGRSGEVAATDGRQLFIQRGFPFPWKADVLVPRVQAFAGRELAGAAPVRIGKSDTHVVLTAGPWTFWLGVDKESRFPDVRAVVPAPSPNASRLHLDPRDAKFLAAAIPRLPGGGDTDAPVTLDLSSPPAVRANGEGGPATELVLSFSSSSGPPVRLRSNRGFLQRGLSMGFAELQVSKPDGPVCGRDERRCYLWMALDPADAVPASPDALRIASDRVAVPASPQPSPRRNGAMATSSSNNRDSETRNAAPVPPADRATALDSLIGEAEAVRALLQEAGGRFGKLVSSLRQQRRQGRVVQTAVAALRQLQLDR